MSAKVAVFVCLQALFVQSFSAQCIGAYNGLNAGSWPASNALAWDSMAWPAGDSFAWDAGVPYGAAAPCGASALAGAYPAASWAPSPFAGAEWGSAYSPASLAASNGGGLAVSSASPIAPNGVSMNSENIYEGPLAVSGAVPFLGAVAIEGALPTRGSGGVAYGCGNGNVAILNEDYASGYGVGPIGYGAGIAGPYGSYGYNSFAGPLAMEAGIAGPAYGYSGMAGARAAGCGCGSVF